MARAEAAKDDGFKPGAGQWPPRPGADKAPWPPPPPREDLIVSLTDLLRTRLSQAIDSTTGKTWAQHLIDIWLGEALDGNLRAIQEIADRIDGAGTTSRPSSVDLPAIDESTASRILESLCGPDDDLPGD